MASVGSGIGITPLTSVVSLVTIDTMSTTTRKTQWDHIIKIGDVIYDDDLTFEQKRDAVVKRILKSSAVRDGTRGEELRALAGELGEAADADDYDWIIGDIYDLADAGKWLWLGP